MKFQLFRFIGLFMSWILLLLLICVILWQFEKISLTYTARIEMAIGIVNCVIGSAICLSIKEENQ